MKIDVDKISKIAKKSCGQRGQISIYADRELYDQFQEGL